MKNVDSMTRREGAKHLVRMSSTGPNAGLIIIGDEILKGQTRDTNSYFMTKRLRDLGVRVSRISVIPDELETIAEEVKKFSMSYDHVVTSGGIGPTHDDLTFEGIALAFGHEVDLHPQLVAIISKWAKSDDVTLPHYKMARVSKEAKLKFGKDPKTGKLTNFPIVCVKNVYAFPGVPNLVEHAFPLLEQDLFCSSSSSNPTFHGREIYLRVGEPSVAQILNAFHEEFAPKGVALGSYPKLIHSYYKVKLTLESTDESAIASAHSTLLASLPAEFVLSDYDPHPLTNMGEKLTDFMSKEEGTAFGLKLSQTVSVIEDCLTRYSIDEVCLAFNGGKDCTALLHLFAAVLKKKQPERQGFKAMYIKKGSPFPEVEKFVEEMKKEFQLEMIIVSGSIKHGLKKIKDDNPNLKAAIMGTRRTDPYSSHLNAFTETDPDWPPYMRVNPILDWTYKDIWYFLRALSLPYCELYDQGYTSLGSADNTFPCPKLEYVNEFGKTAFHPAYKLETETEEREGRV